MTISETIRKVLEEFNVSEYNLLSKNRKGDVRNARKVICYLLRKHNEMSYQSIANELG